MTDLKGGTVIVAHPKMSDDPMFGRSVILLVSKNERGITGHNLAGDILLDVLQLGGPIETPAAILIYCDDDRSARFKIGDSGYACAIATQGEKESDWQSFPELPAETIKAGVLVFGKAGWAPGQLEGEMEAGVWAVTTTAIADLFKVPPDQRYDLASKGATFGEFKFG
jgi:putative transcriptional regulator